MTVSGRRGLFRYIQLLFCYSSLNTVEGLQQPRQTKRATSAQQRIQVRSSSSWNSYFQQLQEFRNKHGHTVVRKSDNPNLYRWTCLQRANYRHQAEDRPGGALPRPKLSAYKLQQLSSIGFVWDVQEYRWSQRLQELREYVRAHNSTLVRANYPSALGVWVQNQRREYKRWLHGENSTLTVSRVLALKELQFDKDMKSWKDLWDQRYQELVEFHRLHGHVNVPEDYKPNPSLGQWVMNQRTQYRRYADGEASTLTEERMELLDKLEFRWKYREDKWHEMKLRLLDYYEEHGHLRIATNDTANSDLRLWLNLQRHFYNRMQQDEESPLTKERVVALESEIPNFPWRGRNKAGPSKSDWARMLAAIKDKGFEPGTRAKSHWFEGINPLKSRVKSVYTEQELLELWYSGEDDD